MCYWPARCWESYTLNSHRGRGDQIVSQPIRRRSWTLVFAGRVRRRHQLDGPVRRSAHGVLTVPGTEIDRRWRLTALRRRWLDASSLTPGFRERAADAGLSLYKH
jgi:hypothetical protein